VMMLDKFREGTSRNALIRIFNQQAERSRPSMETPGQFGKHLVNRTGCQSEPAVADRLLD